MSKTVPTFEAFGVCVCLNNPGSLLLNVLKTLLNLTEWIFYDLEWKKTTVYFKKLQSIICFLLVWFDFY